MGLLKEELCCCVGLQLGANTEAPTAGSQKSVECLLRRDHCKCHGAAPCGPRAGRLVRGGSLPLCVTSSPEVLWQSTNTAQSHRVKHAQCFQMAEVSRLKFIREIE